MSRSHPALRLRIYTPKNDVSNITTDILQFRQWGAAAGPGACAQPVAGGPKDFGSGAGFSSAGQSP